MKRNGWIYAHVGLTLSTTEVGRFYGLGRGVSVAPILPELWAVKRSRYSLYTKPIGILDSFPSKKKAKERIRRLDEGVRVSVKVHRETLDGRKVLFTKNAVERATD